MNQKVEKKLEESRAGRRRVGKTESDPMLAADTDRPWVRLE